MKHTKTLLLGILLALLSVSAAAAAPDDADDIRDARVISARAGRVNFVSGDVRVRRAGALEWGALAASDELKSGDTVSTGADGRVEVLLNPGSYFRAGAGAEFTLAEADLEDLRVELARGGAVVEAMGYGDDDLSITVATARTTVRVVRTGVYRINALADGRAEVGVFKGRALLDGVLVKGEKLARPGASGVEVSKLDKKNRDQLDLWSRDRGKELARANVRIRRSTLHSIFARNGFNDAFGQFGSRHGFWYFNDRTQCYTFLPFGYGWRSPYGYWYDTGVVVRYQDWPRQWPSPNQGPGYTPPPGTGGGASGQPPIVTSPGGNGGGMSPVRPSPGDMPDRMPSNPRPERSPGEGRQRRDNR